MSRLYLSLSPSVCPSYTIFLPLSLSLPLSRSLSLALAVALWLSLPLPLPCAHRDGAEWSDALERSRTRCSLHPDAGVYGRY